MRRLAPGGELARWRASLHGDLGLVPTMGALHDGHLALVRRAVAENERALATVFVNPAQFDDAGDLAAYPRDLARDARLLEEAGCDALFAPRVDEIYPPGFDTWIEPGAVARGLEGEARPGHFRGVATVVARLFLLCRPTRAYFGRKDAQQLAVIRKMTCDLGLPVEVVACDTVREPDGLAMSSRNRRLDATARRAAPRLYGALTAARAAWEAGASDAERLRREMRRALAAEPAVELDYVSVADPETLGELERVEPRRGALLSLAASVGGVRLIDNLTLPPRRTTP